MSAKEKIAYLKGLIDGQNLKDESPDKAKFYDALTAALESLAAADEEIFEVMAEHEELHEDLNEYLEQLEEDVTDIEEELDELNDDDCCCDEDDDEDFEDFDEEEYRAVTCPHCGKVFYFEPGNYGEDEDLVCPHCGKPFKLPEE